MKNLLKKTVSILIALTILLCAVSTFAEEATETGEVNVPTFEVGSGMGGTLQPDVATEIRVHAGKRGRVQFALTLAEDCGVSVAVNGGGASLARPDDNLPVYTFISRLEWDESKTLSMTADRTVGYSISSELIPEEPAPEAKLEPDASAEVPEPVPEPAMEPAVEPAEEPVAEPAAEPAAAEPVEEPAAEPVQEPATESAESPEVQSAEEPVAEHSEDFDTGLAELPAAEPAEEPATEPAEEPATEPAEEPATEPAEEPATEPANEPSEAPMSPEENSEPEQLEPTITEDGTTEQPAAPAEDINSDTETGEPVQPAQPETISETAENDNSSAEEQAVQMDKQSEEQKSEEKITEEQQSEQPEYEQLDTDNPEEAVGNEEINIAKILTPGDSWNGTVRNKKQLVLQLDIAEPRMIHMLVEGKDVCYSVQKSDRITDDAVQAMTDAVTNRSVTSWSAEAGSYLIAIHAGENSLMARVAVTFMTEAELEAWEAEQNTFNEVTEEHIVTALSDAEMLEMGYYKVQTVRRNGADVYESIAEGSEPISHLSHGCELWVKATENGVWAEIYNEETEHFVKWDDLLIVVEQEKETAEEDVKEGTEVPELKEETNREAEDEPIARSVTLKSTLDGVLTIEEETPITLTAELEGFREDDQYSITWLTSYDNGETFQVIDGADGLEYSYLITVENAHNIWRISIMLE